MNKVSKYLISIDRHPYLNGRKVGQAIPCQSYGKPAWSIAYYDGYGIENNPVFTDEDGLNGATTIIEYAKNLGFEIEE
jgi:hypothetical protein